MSKRRFSLFVSSAPGLEPLVLGELTGLGLTGRVEPGGVALSTSLSGLYRTLLGVGTGFRVLLRVARFRALNFSQLEHELSRAPWGEVLPAAPLLRIRATSRKSKLYHTGAIAERIERGLASVLGPPEQTTGEGLMLQARFERDVCTLSLDLCGDPLSKRGYRQQTAKAPLREDLARALLLLAGFDGRAALLDPLCGAGTLVIEAARLALKVPPGQDRGFAVSELPFHAPAVFDQALRGLLPAAPLPALRPLWGSDRDQGAVLAAQANAERGGVGDVVRFSVGALSRAELPEGPGLIVANPPYGKRLGSVRALRDLYAALGALRRRAPAGSRLALVTPEPELARATGVSLRSALMTDAGGIKVRFYLEEGADEA